MIRDILWFTIVKTWFNAKNLKPIITRGFQFYIKFDGVKTLAASTS